MSCRKISMPFLFAIAFLAPTVGLVDSCIADESLLVTVNIEGGRETCKSQDGFCVCTKMEPVTGTGSDRLKAEACKKALDDLKKKIDDSDPPGPGKGYYIVSDANGCCRIPGLCPKKTECPKFDAASGVDRRTSTGCGKYEVRVSCRRCDNGREVSITYQTNRPYIDAIRMRNALREFLKEECTKCSGRIVTKIEKICSCGCH
jgi:hypothetical protein